MDLVCVCVCLCVCVSVCVCVLTTMKDKYISAYIDTDISPLTILYLAHPLESP